MLQSLLPGPVEAALALAVGWAITYLAHSSLALGAAWLVDGRTPWTRSPRARSFLWLGAVAVSLLTAGVQAAAGPGPRIELAASQAEKAVVEFRRSAPAGGTASASGRTGPSAPEMRRPHAADRLDPVAWYRSLGHDWPFLLAGLWGIGALILLLRGAAGARTLRSDLSAREPVGPGPVRRALEEAASEAGLGDGVRLTRCPGLRGPVALPGREVCVPDRLLRELGEDQLRAVLAHEAAHLARRDTAALLALEAARRVLFFQPLLRLARRRFEEAAEAASDERVRRLGLGVPLADGLLAVARRMRNRRPPVRPAGLARTPALERRVRRLLAPVSAAPAEPGRGRGTALAAAGIFAAALLVGGPGARIPLPAHATTAAHGAAERPLGAEVAAAVPADGPAPVAELLQLSTGPEARLGTLLDRAGTTLLVKIGPAEGRISVTLRPGGERIRLVDPDGRTRRISPPSSSADGGALVAVRVPRPPPGRWELHLPPDVRRLGLSVGGRSLPVGTELDRADLPEPISPF